ncbi:MAG: TOBE domain-containing protein [Coriobacteriales bacterium]|jgi:molybdate transport system regulatory protein
MKISARNQLQGVISSVTDGAVNGVVTIDLGADKIKADITMAAIEELGLAEGKKAFAIIKASNVMFAASDKRVDCISARNQLVGTICAVEKGAVNGHVSLEIGDHVIKGSITNAAIDDLGLKEGDTAVAIVKASDVMVGIEE